MLLIAYYSQALQSIGKEEEPQDGENVDGHDDDEEEEKEVEREEEGGGGEEQVRERGMWV